LCRVYVDDKEKYDYTKSGTNDFCKNIYEYAGQKWADGLRWVHGEDLLTYFEDFCEVKGYHQIGYRKDLV